MKVKNTNFPHPILQDGADDYIDCEFDIEIDLDHTTIEGDDIILAVSYALKCPGLEDYLLKNKASVLITVQSVALSYRQNFYFDNDISKYFKVPKNDVSKKVEIVGYIVASNEIKPFTLPEHNPIYFASTSFSVRKGDVLAKSKQIDIPIDDSELEKPLQSIFDITKDEYAEKDIFPVFEGDKIKIILKPETFNIYDNLRRYNNGTYRRALNGLIVLPVLIEAIDLIKLTLRESEGVRDNHMFDKRWCKAIEKKLDEKGIDLHEYDEQSTSLASELLGSIVSDAVVTFKLVIDDELSGTEVTRIGGND